MTALTPYCSEADMQAYFSQNGITAFADNDGDGTEDPGVVTGCISQSTQKIANSVFMWYDPASLVGNVAVNRWAFVIATLFLCRHRGNTAPQSVLDDYNETISELNGIKSGEDKLYGQPLVAALVPTFSNEQIDRRMPYSTPRVTPDSSQEPSTRTQNTVINAVPGPFGC